MLPNWGENEKCVLWMKFPSNQQFLSFSSFCFFVFFPFLLFLVLVLISHFVFFFFLFLSLLFSLVFFFYFHSSVLNPLACALFFLSFKFEVSIPKFLSKICVTFCFRYIIINSSKLHFSSQPNK